MDKDTVLKIGKRRNQRFRIPLRSIHFYQIENYRSQNLELVRIFFIEKIIFYINIIFSKYNQQNLSFQSKEFTFTKKTTLELLKAPYLCYDFCLIDWKLLWTVGDKKKQS